MDSEARIRTYQQGLRLRFADDVPGLRALCRQLFDEVSADAVVFTSHGFEGGQAAGQIALEPMQKLEAAQTVLAELDPDNVPADPSTRVRYADFSGSGAPS